MVRMGSITFAWVGSITAESREDDSGRGLAGLWLMGAKNLCVEQRGDEDCQPVGEEVPRGKVAAEENDARQREAEGVERGRVVKLEKFHGCGEEAGKERYADDAPRG